MLILNVVKTLKLSNFRKLKKYFSTNFTENQSVFHEKFNTKLYSNEKYNKCMEYGLSLDKIQTNEWIFNMNIRELYIVTNTPHKEKY